MVHRDRTLVHCTAVLNGVFHFYSTVKSKSRFESSDCCSMMGFEGKTIDTVLHSTVLLYWTVIVTFTSLHWLDGLKQFNHLMRPRFQQKIASWSERINLPYLICFVVVATMMIMAAGQQTVIVSVGCFFVFVMTLSLSLYLSFLFCHLYLSRWKWCWQVNRQSPSQLAVFFVFVISFYLSFSLTIFICHLYLSFLFIARIVMVTGQQTVTVSVGCFSLSLSFLCICHFYL